MRRLLLILVVLSIAARASAAEPEWPTAKPSASGLSESRLAAMAEAVRSGGFKNITSIAVSRRGRLVFESYFGGADANTMHNTRSATKTVTGMLIGIAIDRGLLPGVERGFSPSFRIGGRSRIRTPARSGSPSQTSSR
jgi:CubicO group peptidase (beta-lactamase class C family)